MKGFVLIDDSEFALRFVVSRAFDELAAQYDLTFCVFKSARPSPGLLELLRKRHVRFIEIPNYAQRFRRFCDLFDISCELNRDRSPSFEERAARVQREEPLRYRYIRRWAKPSVYERYRSALEKRMGVHPDLLRVTLELKPSFYVIASALLDPYTDEALWIAEKLNIPTLLLVAGWDNLSSKGLLYRQPTRMGVWGEQTKRHAVAVQNTPNERVAIVGAPHFEDYRTRPVQDSRLLRRQLSVPETGRLVLFAGTVRPFDETELLELLDHAIENGEVAPMHVVYRPHPLRHVREREANFLSGSFRHISMDPEMVEGYQQHKQGQTRALPANFLGRSQHLVQLYNTVDAVVSPMSTILLEALVLGLPVMATSFGDGKHSFGVHNASRMLHFKELYEIPEVVICRSRDTFVSDLQQLVSTIGDANRRVILRNASQFFVLQDQRSYAERVAEELKTMLRSSHSPDYRSARLRAGRRFLVEDLVRKSRVYQLWSLALTTLERKLAS